MSISLQPLFEAYPEWRPLSRSEVDDDGSDYLVVEVAAPPSADVERGLLIYTAHDEINIGFDHYHWHFGDWTGDDGDSALEFIAQIVDERIAVISWWLDDQWAGSSQTRPGEPLESPRGIGSYNRVRVRSWRGTFNRDHAIRFSGGS